jgi:hypothetical protein
MAKPSERARYEHSAEAMCKRLATLHIDRLPIRLATDIYIECSLRCVLSTDVRFAFVSDVAATGASEMTRANRKRREKEEVATECESWSGQ